MKRIGVGHRVVWAAIAPLASLIGPAGGCADIVGIQEVDTSFDAGVGDPSTDAGAQDPGTSCLGAACAACAGCEVVELTPGEARTLVGTTTGSGLVDPGAVGACARGAPGPEKVYAVETSVAGVLTASIARSGSDGGKPPFDSVLYVLSSCCDPASVARCEDSGDATEGEVMSIDVSDPGSPVFVVVDGAEAAAAGDFELTLTLAGG